MRVHQTVGRRQRCVDCSVCLDAIGGRCAHCAGYICPECVTYGPGQHECQGCAVSTFDRLCEAIDDEKEVRR